MDHNNQNMAAQRQANPYSGWQHAVQPPRPAGTVPVQPLGRPAISEYPQADNRAAGAPTSATPQPAQHPNPPPPSSSPPRSQPAATGKLTPWSVAKAIPGSIGSLDTIARRLNVPRLELRRFISENKELREALDDEMLAAKERLIEKTYQDGMDGQPQARQDFFKMVSGYFEKRGGRDEEMARSQVIIHLDSPSEKVKMLGDDGEIIMIPRDDLSSFKGGDDSLLLAEASGSDDGDDDEEEGDDDDDGNGGDEDDL